MELRLPQLPLITSRRVSGESPNAGASRHQF